MFVKRILFLAILIFCAASAPAAWAQERISIIRDAEIENTIRAYATPLFQQAGVDPLAVNIYLVKDNRLNAFVAAGLNLFINTGLIIRTENPGQLIGVIAHESGHIAGGHLVRGAEAYSNAAAQSLASFLLGAAAAIATGRGDVGSAVMMGGSNIAERNYLSFSRATEGAADTAGMSFLDKLGMSSRGFLEFMETLEGEELLVTDRQDPYVRTHPLSADRIAEIRHHVEKSPYSDVPVPAEFIEPHQRMRAKLYAFFNPPVSTLARYKEDDPAIWARYARAIAFYRRPDLPRALEAINALIAERPNDPFFHELKGQMLFENGHPREAVPEYEQAVKLLPGNALLYEELGHIQIEAEDPALIPQAKINLQTATRLDPEQASAWRSLAIAYGKGGDDVMVSTAMAEYALLAERWEEAIFHSQKALKGLKTGTPQAMRMEDVLSQAEIGRDRARQNKR